MEASSEAKSAANPREDARRRIYRVAAQLFTEQGFHAVSIRDIASASEVSVSTVLYHGGSKQQLLERIVAEAFSAQTPLSQIAEQLSAETIVDRQTFIEVYDALIDVLIRQAVDFPQIRRLWLRLLLDEPSLFHKLDAEFSLPIADQVCAAMRTLRDRGVLAGDDDRFRYFIAGIDWALDGFFAGGVFDAGGRRSQPTEPAEIARLAAFLKDYGRSFFVR